MWLNPNNANGNMLCWKYMDVYVQEAFQNKLNLYQCIVAYMSRTAMINANDANQLI